MLMGVSQALRAMLRKIGYDLVRHEPENHPDIRVRQLFKTFCINTVFDVGANRGQYAHFLRNDIGYRGTIISFEPLSSAFMSLSEKADKDPSWEAFNIALGDVQGEAEINIAGNSYSSSFLGMLPSHLKSAPDSKYCGKEVIEIKTLDSIFDSLCGKKNNIYMKIDTQGFEEKVLNGAQHSLHAIDTVQLEMSLVPLYEGEMIFNELYSLMSELGYSLAAIIPGFADKDSGQLLQVDGIFHRFK